jgi:hypothetical protein
VTPGTVVEIVWAESQSPNIKRLFKQSCTPRVRIPTSKFKSSNGSANGLTNCTDVDRVARDAVLAGRSEVEDWLAVGIENAGPHGPSTSKLLKHSDTPTLMLAPIFALRFGSPRLRLRLGSPRDAPRLAPMPAEMLALMLGGLIMTSMLGKLRLVLMLAPMLAGMELPDMRVLAVRLGTNVAGGPDDVLEVCVGSDEIGLAGNAIPVVGPVRTAVVVVVDDTVAGMVKLPPQFPNRPKRLKHCPRPRPRLGLMLARSPPERPSPGLSPRSTYVFSPIRVEAPLTYLGC